MLQELGIVIRLQEIDNRLSELEEEKGDLPEQIENLSCESAKFESELSETVSKSDELIAEDKKVRNELAEGRERLKKSQGTIYSVKTNREYDAISSEIEHAKAQVERCENKLIEIELQSDGLKEVYADLQKKLKLVKKDLDDRMAEMKDKTDSSQEAILSLIHEREKNLVRLKKPVIAHYERIRKIRDGIGVCYLIGNACSYCYSVIPPQRLVEVRKMEDLILCEVCGCILVSEDNAPGLIDH